MLVMQRHETYFTGWVGAVEAFWEQGWEGCVQEHRQCAAQAAMRDAVGAGRHNRLVAGGGEHSY